MSMNVNLTPQPEDMVRQKVASGLYTSASEVVREALRLMEDQDQLRAAKLAQLRQDIRDGLIVAIPRRGTPKKSNVKAAKGGPPAQPPNLRFRCPLLSHVHVQKATLPRYGITSSCGVVGVG